MKAFFSKLNFKAPAWLNIVSLVLGILSTLFFGTTSTITVDGKNGSEITVTLKATAIPAALEACDFKKLGDKCTLLNQK